MGPLTLFKIIIALLMITQQSNQTSPNDIGVSLQDIKSIILDMKYQMDDMDRRLRRVDDTIENDIRGKIHNMQSEVDVQGLRSSEGLRMIQNSVKGPLVDIKEQGATILQELDTMKQQRSSVEGPLVDIKEQGAAILQELDTMKQQRSSVEGPLVDIKEQGATILQELDTMKQQRSSVEGALNQIAEDKTLLMFNPVKLTSFIGQETHLDCGVIGLYKTCQWEHSDKIYQVADVTAESYHNIRYAGSHNNQCGIVITSVNTSHTGLWTCKVHTTGNTFTASKTLNTIGYAAGKSTNVRSTRVTSNSMKVEWSHPLDNILPITKYVVKWVSSIGEAGHEDTVTVPHYNITGLIDCTEYNITVIAYTEKAPGEPSDTVTLKTEIKVQNGFEVFHGRVIRRTLKTDAKGDYDSAMYFCSKFDAKPFIPRTRQDYQLYKEVRTSLDGWMWLPANDRAQEATLSWHTGEIASDLHFWDWWSDTVLYDNADGRDCLVYGMVYGYQDYFWSSGEHAVLLYDCNHSDYPPLCEKTCD